MSGTPIFFAAQLSPRVAIYQGWLECPCNGKRWEHRFDFGRFIYDCGPDADVEFPKRRKCPTCGERKAKLCSLGPDEILLDTRNGKELRRSELPPGAVYEVNPRYARPGPDGRSLTCVLPDGHHWNIDGRANNCDMPDDDEHYCWNRSGKPEDGSLDVRKGKPGQTTCGAGAGSIATSNWHGFLHNGRLVVC